MARHASLHPTDVELEILQVLWDREQATLGEIVGALQARRPVAKTTVATMLSVMLDKKLVRRKRTTRGYEWRASVSRSDAAEGMLAKLLDGIFDGSARRLVMHLVESGELSAADRRELARLLASAPGKTPSDDSSGGPK